MPWFWIVFIVLLAVIAIWKGLKLALKLLWAVTLCITLAGVIIAATAFIEGRLLQDDFKNGPLLIFYEDGQARSGAIVRDPVEYVDPTIIETYDIDHPDLLGTKRAILIDVAVIGRSGTWDGSYDTLVDDDVSALSQQVREQGDVFLLVAYLDGTMRIRPEPVSYAILRKQPFIPAADIVGSTIFRTVIQGADR